jgi:hypothetical protein
MRELRKPAVCEPIRPTALRDSLGVKWTRELDPLRRALLTPRTEARPRPQRIRQVIPPDEAELTPQDVVTGAPAAGRVCEAYHRAYGELKRRGRRQRMGLAGLASAVAVTAAVLVHQDRLDVGQLRVMVVTPAMLALAGLGVLAFLGLRDWRRLTDLQGQRMLRGIDRGSTLPAPRVQAFLAGYPTAAAAFLACYDAWRRMAATPRLRLGMLLEARP